MQASEHLQTADRQTHTHARAKQPGGRVRGGGVSHEVPAASATLVTFKGSCCINQVRPVQA